MLDETDYLSEETGAHVFYFESYEESRRALRRMSEGSREDYRDIEI